MDKIKILKEISRRSKPNFLLLSFVTTIVIIGLTNVVFAMIDNIKKWEDICKEIGADSLNYTTISGLKDAIRSEDICKGCIDFPCGYPSEWKQEVMALFKKDKHGLRAYESDCLC